MPLPPSPRLPAGGAPALMPPPPALDIPQVASAMAPARESVRAPAGASAAARPTWCWCTAASLAPPGSPGRTSPAKRRVRGVDITPVCAGSAVGRSAGGGEREAANPAAWALLALCGAQSGAAPASARRRSRACAQCCGTSAAGSTNAWPARHLPHLVRQRQGAQQVGHLQPPLHRHSCLRAARNQRVLVPRGTPQPAGLGGGRAGRRARGRTDGSAGASHAAGTRPHAPPTPWGAMFPAGMYRPPGTPPAGGPPQGALYRAPPGCTRCYPWGMAGAGGRAGRAIAGEHAAGGGAQRCAGARGRAQASFGPSSGSPLPGGRDEQLEAPRVRARRRRAERERVRRGPAGRGAHLARAWGVVAGEGWDRGEGRGTLCRAAVASCGPRPRHARAPKQSTALGRRAPVKTCGALSPGAAPGGAEVVTSVACADRLLPSSSLLTSGMSWDT